MAEEYAQLGTAGVMLVDEEYHAEDGSVETAQNAEMVADEENGGNPSLQKRGGYLPSGAAEASAIIALVEIRFIAELA